MLICSDYIAWREAFVCDQWSPGQQLATIPLRGIVPASYDEVITVAAMADWNGQPASASPGTPPVDCELTDTDDAFASFSDFGADVDPIAPGVCVLSLLPVDLLGPHRGGGRRW